MSSAKAPAPPDQSQSYEKQVQIDLKYAPQQAQAEYENRLHYDPLYAQQQLQLMQQYGPQYAQYAQQIQSQIDPQTFTAHQQLGDAVNSDLKQGYNLDPRMAQQIQQSVRAGQVARGNYLGNAPITAEATQTGNAAAQMYQQRLANVGSYLGLPSATSNATQGAALGSGAAPNTNFQFINRQAGQQGQQFALSNYQNQLAAANFNAQHSGFATAMQAIQGVGQIAGAAAMFAM